MGNVYLPIVGGPGQFEHPYVKELESLIVSSPTQCRARMVRDSILMSLAHYRVMDMIQNNYFGHVDINGYGPNYHAVRMGFKLPEYYSQQQAANNIESVAGGQSNATDVFNALMSSTGHRAHLMGEIPFYRMQEYYGIGYAYQQGTTYGHYWCIIIAEKNNE